MLPLDVPVAEHRLEADLRKSLTEHRTEALGMPGTQWDEGLAFLLMPALASYEAEAVTGQPAAGTEDFQQSIKRSTPAGSMFKGVPQHHRCACLLTCGPFLLGCGIENSQLSSKSSMPADSSAQGCAPAPQVRRGLSKHQAVRTTIERGCPCCTYHFEWLHCLQTGLEQVAQIIRKVASAPKMRLTSRVKSA